ncbi:MAG: HDIG domain-containing protein [Muribaculaceae bacterium]|nr:HDIG domain-containing protein [Muribaculaceae bacterium]
MKTQIHKPILDKLTKRGVVIRFLIGLAAALIITYFYPHPESSHYKYEQNRPWNYAKLIAPFDIPIHADSATILAARDSLEAHFVPVYEINQLMIDSVVAELPPSVGNNYHNDLASRLRKIYSSGVVDYQTREKIAEGKLPKVRILEKNVLSEMSTSHFTSPRDIYVRLDTAITDKGMHDYFTSANLQDILKPNIIHNEAESRRHYDYDYLTLTADRGVIQQGQTIIDKGTIISPQDFTNLRTYERMVEASVTKAGKSDWLMLGGQFLYVVLLLSTLCGYIYYYNRLLFDNIRSFGFVIILITVFFLIALALNTFVSSGIYIAPMAIVPVLLLVFFDGRTALLVSTVLTLICAAITSFPLEFIFLQFTASAVAVYSLRSLAQRSQLLRTAGFVAAAYLLSYIALELLMNGTFEGFAWRMIAYLLVNSALCSMAYVLMSAVERMFGFISDVTLVELADTNHPLLIRLNDECPGTFQHSLSVSNLAADAAKRIGANDKLVRAGAMYHDVGKLSNPAFFTENQHGVNPHDALSPEQSGRIVVNHVIDGLRRADKAGLPSVIKDFIREHHGSGKAKYFYYTYCKLHPGEEIDPTPFQYPGPNPRSRETAVLMMADAVEAASRSLKEHTPQAIADLVNKIIDGQIADGMFDESPLEFRDIPVIKEAFIKRLKTIYHSRIVYPDAPKNAAQSARDEQ